MFSAVHIFSVILKRHYPEFGNDLRVGSHSSVVQDSILLGCDSLRNTASHPRILESSYMHIFTSKYREVCNMD